MLPIVLTKKQNILIVGAGRACQIKLKILSKIDCDITIVAQEFPIDFKNLKHTKIIQDFYSLDKSFFEPFDLIYVGIALENTTMIEYLAKIKMINILSNPSLSNFIHPCTRDNQDILVSVINIKEKNPKKACVLVEKFIKLLP